MAYCILICTSVVPYIGVLSSLAALIVLIFFLKSVKDGAVLMPEQSGR